MADTFTGWPVDATTFLGELAAENTPEFWESHRHRHAASVRGPMQAVAADLEAEFGPVRVFRAHVNRRFRPDAAPLRTDTGGTARSGGGSVLAVVLGAAALSASAGHWSFDGGQLARFRRAVAGAEGEELEAVLAGLAGFDVDDPDPLVGVPRGYPRDHPRTALLRHRGLQATRTWPVGPWLATAEPLDRIRDAWRAAGPLVEWLDRHVGSADAVPARPRPGSTAAAEPAPNRG